MTLGWVMLVALAAGFAGGLGAGAAGRWVRRGLERHRGRSRRMSPRDPALDAEQTATQLDVKNIRSDLGKVQRAVEAVQAEVSMLARKLAKPAENRPLAPTPARPRTAPPVEPDDPWRDSAPPRAPDYSPDAPATGAPAEPPMNAINVEARDDRLVGSRSYPPEAWLEPGGPASGQLSLNPSVALNEYALRRLSTFFHWEEERPGAAYETVRPAQIQWDEGRRTGTVIERGSARPR